MLTMAMMAATSRNRWLMFSIYIQASGSALAALLGDESLKPGAMLTMAMMASTSSNPR
jgi:hypothetical protein